MSATATRLTAVLPCGARSDSSSGVRPDLRGVLHPGSREQTAKLLGDLVALEPKDLAPRNHDQPPFSIRTTGLHLPEGFAHHTLGAVARHRPADLAAGH